MPSENKPSCLACGAVVFSPLSGASGLLYCISAGCHFNTQPIEAETHRVLSSLTGSARRTGYQAALDDMSVSLTRLERDHGDRGSNRSDTHTDKAVPR